MEVIRLLRRRPWGIMGAVVILVVIVMAAVAPFVTPYHFNEMSIGARLLPPGGDHILGTDNLGRDVFTRVLYSARLYVLIGLLVTGGALALGLVLGFVAARIRGKTDKVLRIAVVVPAIFLAGIVLLIEMANLPRLWAWLGYVPTFWMHLSSFWVHIFPGLIFDPGFLPRDAAVSTLTFLAKVWNPGSASVSTSVSVGLGLVLFPPFFFVARRAFFKARRVHDIVPGAERPATVSSFLSAALVGFGVATGLAILVISPADYMGYGTPPPIPTWGGMVSGAGYRYSLEAPWMVVAPAIALFSSIAGGLLLAAATREVWVPTLPTAQLPTTGKSLRAGFWRRWIAALVDVLICAIPGYGILRLVAALAPDSPTFALTLAIFLGAWLVAAVYLVVFWRWSGSTPGMMLLNLKLVSAKGENHLDMNQVLRRALGYLVSILTLGIGFLLIAFDVDKRGLADRLAGTLVVMRH